MLFRSSSELAGVSIPFSGTALDTEEGDLSEDLSWTSDLDGPIGTGPGFSLSTLSVGSHLITASATDVGGLSGWDQVAIQVQANTPPVVAIAEPTDGASAVDGQPVAFGGAASDAEEGDVSLAIQWSSDLDGFIGASGSFVTSSLSVGQHQITASVTDAGGLSSWDQIALAVGPNTEIGRAHV